MSNLIECIPNFSEGRRPEVIEQIVAAIAEVPGVQVLDVSSDADHNRSVVTFVAPPKTVGEAAFAAIVTASALIDMRQHSGQHPRLGATDVCPFVPLGNNTLAECVGIAHNVGQRVGEVLRLPVYLYEAAALRPERENLANVRRGEYEGLVANIASDPSRQPDFGPSAIGPAGAVAIGARKALIAFNVYLNTDQVAIAQKIARAIRHSNGGLRYVKALGLLVEGQAQVSMNLTDFTRTPLPQVMELIRVEARRYGVSISRSELIGLIPQEALLATAAWYLQLDDFSAERVLENRLGEPGRYQLE